MRWGRRIRDCQSSTSAGPVRAGVLAPTDAARRFAIIPSTRFGPPIHARHASPPCPDRFSRPAPASPRHAAGQSRLSLQPVLPALPRQCRAEPHRGDVARDRRRGPRAARGQRRRIDARRHRRRAGAQPPFPPPRRRRARSRRAGHRPLQPHHPDRARPGGPRRVPRRATASRSSPRCPATSRTTSTASAARACSNQRSRALQQLNALGYGREGAGLCSTWSTTRKGPSLPPAQEQLEADYKRILGEQHGIVFNRLFTLANMPIQRFGSTLVSKGQFNEYMALLRERAPGREPRRRDVPHADLGRLAGLPLRLRLQPDARPADALAGKRAAARAPTCSAATSPAIRSWCAATATAAPPGRGRVAAARSA